MSATGVDDTDLYNDTITILTRAATKGSSDGTPDFADFLAHVLAATAANVGGPDQLVAGRPGSWESSYVDGLVRGTMGDRPDDWTWFRTQPIVIPLNVAELIEDELHHPGLMGLGEALENFDRRLDSLYDDCDIDAWDYGIDTITARYTAEYRLYAERFTRAAQRLAEEIPGLTAEVYIEADTNPNSYWWSGSTITNPDDVGDQLASQQLWHAAHDVPPRCRTSISGLGSCPRGVGAMTMNTADRLMTVTELAEMLSVPVTTLYGWRSRGEGPPGYRIGRHVRYRREAIEIWLASRADQAT